MHDRGSRGLSNRPASIAPRAIAIDARRSHRFREHILDQAHHLLPVVALLAWLAFAAALWL